MDKRCYQRSGQSIFCRIREVIVKSLDFTLIEKDQDLRGELYDRCVFGEIILVFMWKEWIDGRMYGWIDREKINFRFFYFVIQI